MFNKLDCILPPILQDTKLFFSSQKQRMIVVIALSSLAFLSLLYFMKRSYIFIASKRTETQQIQPIAYHANVSPHMGVLNEEDQIEFNESNENSRLLQDAIKKLRDPWTLHEDELIKTKNLSTEKQIIKDCLKETENKKLIDYIKGVLSSQNHENSGRRETMQLLYVLAGIKPGAVIKKIQKDHDDHDQLMDILQQLCSRFSNLRLEEKNHQIFFVNERPLQAFDPRRYLIPVNDKKASLMEALIKYWGSQSTQMLSYLLGYGPTWEAFTNNWQMLFYSNRDMRSPSIRDMRNSSFADLHPFSDEHYRELGEVLLKHHIDFGSNDSIEIGRAYHVQFPKLVSMYRIGAPDYRTRSQGKKYPNCAADVRNIAFYSFVHDGISDRTSYSQKQFHLLKWILSTYLDIGSLYTS